MTPMQPPAMSLVPPLCRCAGSAYCGVARPVLQLLSKVFSRQYVFMGVTVISPVALGPAE